MTRDFAAAREWVAARVEEESLPTAVLGVTSSSEVLLLEAYGTVEGRPVRVDQRYALFSISKVVAGLTAARALERGRLSWHTPLATAVPGAVSGQVTLAQLLSHTSGLVDTRLDDPRPAREQLAGAGLVFAPGAVSQYCNLAFHGAAAVVAAATGRAWEELVAETVAVAGAPGIDYDGAGARPVQGATEAGLDVAAMVAARHPGAGLHARAEDLLTLGRTLLAGGEPVLHPRSYAAMLRPLTKGLPRLEPYPASAGQDWGLSWNLRHAAPGLIERDTHGHAGASGTEFWLLPGLDLCFVLLTDRLAPPVDADQLHNAVATGR